MHEEDAKTQYQRQQKNRSDYKGFEPEQIQAQHSGSPMDLHQSKIIFSLIENCQNKSPLNEESPFVEIFH